jgi:hypothetical protein|nr:hypothetical protein [Enterobacter ludwigii]
MTLPRRAAPGAALSAASVAYTNVKAFTMNTTFLSRTINVLFFSFLTLVSTIYLLERFGVDLLKWRAGSSLLLAYTSALSGAGFAWASELNTIVILLIFLCGGVLVSLLTAYLFRVIGLFSDQPKRS